MYAKRPNREGIRKRVTRHRFAFALKLTLWMELADRRAGQVSSITFSNLTDNKRTDRCSPYIAIMAAESAADNPGDGGQYAADLG